MFLPIVAYGDPVLRKKGADVSPDYSGLKELIANMWDTMYESNGVGLAAPQIGKSLNLFVVDATPMEDPNYGEFKRYSSMPKSLRNLALNGNTKKAAYQYPIFVKM